MKAYRIVDWWKFEMLKNGKLATAKTKMGALRIKPLVYVRFPVHGHILTADYRRMVKRAGPDMTAACDGVYKMLVGLAGNQVREYRGWILDDRQQPMEPGQVAELLCLSEEKTYQIFEILSDGMVNWVNLEEFPELLHSQITKTGNESKTHGSQNTKTGNGFEKTEIGVKAGDFSGHPETLHKSLNGSDLSNGSQIKKSGNFWEKKGAPFTKPNPKQIKDKSFGSVTRACAREVEGGQEEDERLPARPAALASASASVSDTGPVSASERLSVPASDSITASDSASQPGPRAGPEECSSGPISRQQRFEIIRECQKATLELTQIIHPRNNSDVTTINDIFSQLQQRLIDGSPYPLFELSINTARQCWRGNKPIAMFVAAMKKPPFYYVPKKLNVIPGKFSRVKDKK